MECQLHSNIIFLNTLIIIEDALYYRSKAKYKYDHVTGM